MEKGESTMESTVINRIISEQQLVFNSIVLVSIIVFIVWNLYILVLINEAKKVNRRL